MENLRASCRIHVVALAALFCLSLAFVAITDADILARIAFGFLAVVFPIILAARFRKESALVQSHVVAEATVVERKPGSPGLLAMRRSRIKYEFMALDRRQYQGESAWDAAIGMGSTVSVGYSPDNPAVNQPVQSFIFYSPQPYSPQS